MNDFEPREKLYFRWFSNWMDGDAIRPSQIQPPKQSVNRQRHGGRCWFVLIPEPPKPGEDPRPAEEYLCQGVISLRVAEVPCPAELNGKEYRFQVEHDPLEHNYQHCEIRVYEGDTELKDRNQMTKALKKHYRTEMCAVTELVIRPEIATRDARQS